MHTRRLGSAPEIRAHQIIRRTLADTEWTFTANASVQAVLEKEERLSEEEFSLYTRGAFDFVVYDEGFDPVFALELDGFGHDQERQSRRDLLKNALCARAGLPLLRLGLDDLREREETSVLEWLLGAFIAAEQQELDSDVEDEGLPDDLIEEIDPNELESDDDVIGEPGIELEHPFPDVGVIATRRFERHRIAIGELEPHLLAPRGARLVMNLRHPSVFEPARFRSGPSSEFIGDEVRVSVAWVDRPKDLLFQARGAAEFAYANRLPVGDGREALAFVDFPWDALGVAGQLAEFDALRQVERWARSHEHV